MEKICLSFLMVALIISILIAVVPSSAQSNSNSGNMENPSGSVGTTIIPNIAAESGQVWSNKSISSRLIAGSLGKVDSQVLLSFDISSIPKGSIIRSAAIDLSQYELIGDPFYDYCLGIYQSPYISISKASYKNDPPRSYLIWKCSEDGITNKIVDNMLKDALNKRVGTSKFQLRMQLSAKDKKVTPDGCPIHSLESPDSSLCHNYNSYSGETTNNPSPILLDNWKSSVSGLSQRSSSFKCGWDLDDSYKPQSTSVSTSGCPSPGIGTAAKDSAIEFGEISLEITYSTPS